MGFFSWMFGRKPVDAIPLSDEAQQLAAQQRRDSRERLHRLCQEFDGSRSSRHLPRSAKPFQPPRPVVAPPKFVARDPFTGMRAEGSTRSEAQRRLSGKTGRYF